MLRKIFLLICILICMGISAQTDSSHLRISLLTCGTGEEIYAGFGHTAIRITDATKGTDQVYNYGTFNGYEENFEWKFIRGKLLYYLSEYPYSAFLNEYARAQRSVTEQELLIDQKAKQTIKDFLEWNARPEHSSYRYDFVYDNCATRVRDIFSKVLGKDFEFGRSLPEGTKLSFRQIINQYLYADHFMRMGINLLLGKSLDKKMNNEDAMFLPFPLHDAIETAHWKGQAIASSSVQILTGASPRPGGINIAFVTMLILALITIAGLLIPSLKPLGNFMSSVLLFLSGLIGCFILFMWLGTDHQACNDNFNILWALPTNIFLAFSKKNKTKYTVIATILLLSALLLHVLHIQELPLKELWPFLLALLCIYGMIYRKKFIGKTYGN